MALVDVQESWSGVNASVEQATGFGATNWFASKRFTVLFDAAATHLDALTAAGIPANGDAYSGTYGAPHCVRRRANPLGPFLYEVIAEYAGKDSPLLEPYDYRWSSATTNEPIDRDADGDMLVNPCGDPYVGIARPFSDPVWTVSRNEASDPSSTQYAYWNAVNSATFKSWPAKTAFMHPMESYRVVDGASYYWRVTYRVQFRKSGWRPRVRVEGKRYRPTAGAEPVPVKDRLGVETALLQADGTLLPDGGTPLYEYLDIFSAVDFTPLGIS